MSTTILIDAAHREETRVAVLQNNILQDFDREALAIKQIKGNIYLAKVIRVEPSLQAAFIDYDGNKHGFLPFPEIHPSYFTLPEAEKQKLLEMVSGANDRSEEDARESNENSFDEQKTNHQDKERSTYDRLNKDFRSDSHDRSSQQNGRFYDGSNRHNQHSYDNRSERSDNRSDNKNFDDNNDSESISLGAFSAEDEVERFNGNIYGIYKRYQIQDVIKPGQLILIQVVKEERGNKGAAMTTYISLAGKYCVLMPNTPNRGGVSKKVENFRDRKILKSILADLNVPQERSIIIRTAGVGKKPEEIKRDFEYLTKLWESIVESSNNSKPPAFIHAEDDIIKKIIRDVYNEDVREVIVEGKEAFDAVLSFIKLTMSGNFCNIRLHEERVPVFNRYRVEQQISALYEKQIILPSGGTIVIDHTEALVAIDVNSGKATKESGIEETAFRTNIESVKEIARQLRLRDLAGLIVIDFIDMHDQRRRRTVERALRDELQNDRARIQLGRISIFGLLEMSRQRLGASFFETITTPCKACNGTGYTRSVEIIAVSIFRAIRHSCVDSQVGVVYVYTDIETIIYLTNYKKQEITQTEKNYKINIFFRRGENIDGSGFELRKRKSLSEEEKREIEMEVVTGKVNLLEIEKDFIIPAEPESTSIEEFPRHENYRNNNNKSRKRGGVNRSPRRDRYDRDQKPRSNPEEDKKSVFQSLFKFIKKTK